MTEILIPAEVNPTLGSYTSVYSKSYVEAHAELDARKRNWKAIVLAENVFEMYDSSNNKAIVYYSKKIKNCNCDFFTENEADTCPHIKAIDLNVFNFRPHIGNSRNLIYVKHENNAVYKSKDGDFSQLTEITPENSKDCLVTLSVSKFFERKANIELGYNVLPKFDEDLFKPYGIKSFFDHQPFCIRKMVENKRTILTLQMGFGKTLCALYACHILGCKSVIVVCPNSLKIQWQREINRFNLGSSFILSKSSDLENYKDERFLILSYEIANRNKHIFKKKFDLGIMDEIQKIKNSESIAWETMSLLKSDYFFALSGSPIQNSTNDLISILRVINPNVFNPEWKFMEKFCEISKQKVIGWKASALPELKLNISRYIINPKIDLTKFKIPSHVHIEHLAALNEFQATKSENYFDMASILLAKSVSRPLSIEERAYLNAYLLKARQAACDGRLIDPTQPKSEKYQKIEDLIEGHTNINKKVIVYSEWIDTLKLLEPFLEEKKINYVNFNGSISTKKRDKNLQKFITDPDTMVFLSTDSGGLGIDGLQFACHTVIHLEDLWNPMKLKQRNGRVVRALNPSPEVTSHSVFCDSGVEK